MVDLDAALEQGENREVVREICAAVVIPVQIGGGVRTMPDIQAVLELGAARAILGTAARSTPPSWPGPSRSSPNACSSRSTCAAAT